MTARYASLHAGMLARKGQASPAVPSPMSSVSYVDAPPNTGRRDAGRAATEPDRPQKTALAPPPPATAVEPDEPARQAPAASPPAKRRSRLTPRVKTTVRLTMEQRRRLQTAAAQMNTSQQALFSQALDLFLDTLCEGEMKDCACLAKRRG